jgi:predicted RNase H-like nuclease (RuvC/YqgF family)
LDNIIAALVGGAFGIGGTLLTLWATQKERTAEAKENEADAAARIGEAWAALIAPLEKRVKALEDENQRLATRVRELEAENLRKDAVIITLERELDELRKKVGRQRKDDEGQ